VVNVNTRLDALEGGGRAAGTGMIISRNGEIVTNNHVVQGADTVAVTIRGRGTTPVPGGPAHGAIHLRGNHAAPGRWPQAGGRPSATSRAMASSGQAQLRCRGLGGQRRAMCYAAEGGSHLLRLITVIGRRVYCWVL
jgi:hypothetical protein